MGCQMQECWMLGVGSGVRVVRSMCATGQAIGGDLEAETLAQQAWRGHVRLEDPTSPRHAHKNTHTNTSSHCPCLSAVSSFPRLCPRRTHHPMSSPSNPPPVLAWLVLVWAGIYTPPPSLYCIGFGLVWAGIYNPPSTPAPPAPPAAPDWLPDPPPAPEPAPHSGRWWTGGAEERGAGGGGGRREHQLTERQSPQPRTPHGWARQRGPVPTRRIPFTLNPQPTTNTGIARFPPPPHPELRLPRRRLLLQRQDLGGGGRTHIHTHTHT